MNSILSNIEHAAFLQYALESTIIASVFAIIYAAALRSQTYFVAKRAYLIIAPLLSAILPAISIQSLPAADALFGEYRLNEIIVGASVSSRHFELQSFALQLYFAGAGLSFAYFLFQAIRIAIIRLAGEKTVFDGTPIVATRDVDEPFSIFGEIFVPFDAPNDRKKIIIAHEKIHIRRMHCIDALFARIYTIAFWFNPAAYFFARYIAENCEFEADSIAYKSLNKSNKYLDALAECATGLSFAPIENKFNGSLTIRRIKMITQFNRSKKSYIRLFIAAPALALAILLFSSPEYASGAPQDAKPKQAQMEEKDENKKHFSKIDVQPRYKGDLVKDFASKIKYPAKAQMNNIEGTVLLRMFIDKEGNASKIEVVKSLGYGCDEEAIRVAKTLGKFEPAKVDGKPANAYVHLPVNYKLKGDKKKDKK